MDFRLFTGPLIAAVLLVPVAAQSRTMIDDPVKFVTMEYATTVGKKPEPSDIYSPRLEALFDLDQRKRTAKSAEWISISG